MHYTLHQILPHLLLLLLWWWAAQGEGGQLSVSLVVLFFFFIVFLSTVSRAQGKLSWMGPYQGPAPLSLLFSLSWQWRPQHLLSDGHDQPHSLLSRHALFETTTTRRRRRKKKKKEGNYAQSSWASCENRWSESALSYLSFALFDTSWLFHSPPALPNN